MPNLSDLSTRDRKHKSRSLILITVDCLRADHCGFYDYSQPTTPFLNSLASESFVVPTAIVAGAPTYYSFPAILASRMPLALGRDIVGLVPGEPTLATELRASGYATAAFSAANPYISPRFGYDQGFDVFHDFLNRDSLNNDSEPGSPDDAVPPQPAPKNSLRGNLNHSTERLAAVLGLSKLHAELYFQYRMKIAPAANLDALRRFPTADVLVNQAQSWLASLAERPFFLWLHLMDPHSPYYPHPDAFRDLTGTNIQSDRARYLNEYWNRSDLLPSGLNRKRREVVQLYDAGIRWVDSQIARLVDGLKQMNLWDDCALALTADHGEEFLEHGGRYHAPTRLTEEIIRVPLLIRVPGESPAKCAAKFPSSPMSHLHLAPTLLEIAGAAAPSTFHGHSLWSNLQQGIPWDDPAIIECVYGCTNPFRMETRTASRLLGIRESRFKLVMRIEDGAKEEIYDLQSNPTETSVETRNGIVAPGDTRKRLLQTARQHLDKSLSTRDITLRLRARLRDLRYENSATHRDLESAADDLG
jgi:arylsulfatase A-like enzyme